MQNIFPELERILSPPVVSCVAGKQRWVDLGENEIEAQLFSMLSRQTNFRHARAVQSRRLVPQRQDVHGRKNKCIGQETCILTNVGAIYLKTRNVPAYMVCPSSFDHYRNFLSGRGSVRLFSKFLQQRLSQNQWTCISSYSVSFAVPREWRSCSLSHKICIARSYMGRLQNKHQQQLAWK